MSSKHNTVSSKHNTMSHQNTTQISQNTTQHSRNTTPNVPDYVMQDVTTQTTSFPGSLWATVRPTYRSICWSTYRPTLDRYVGRHRDRHIGRGVLVEHRSICRPICRHVCGPICRPIRRHSADTLTFEYRSIVGGLSVECR